MYEMIIISDKSEEKTVYFPKNLYNSTEDLYILKLTDRGTNREYTFELADTLEASYGFYSFKVDFSQIPDGEYEYVVNNSTVSEIPESDYDITYNHFYDTFTGTIRSTTYLDIYRYSLEENYREYDFFATANSSRVDGIPFLANYFDENDVLIDKEYRLPGTYDSVPLTIPEGTKEIIFSHPVPLTLIDRFKVVMKSKSETKQYSTGIIRINELSVKTKEYNENRTYIAYDKQ